MKQPAISVLLSVFNGASYIEVAVESILHQTFRDFEFIIIDDGSTDETSKILDKFTDDRIVRLVNEKNLGLIKSLNKALAVAQGKFIARMDADDISLPDRFQKQLVYMREHPEIGVLGTAMIQVDERGRPISVLVPPIKHELILWQTLFGCAIFHATTMMRRDDLVSVGGYNVNYLHSEDLELWSRLFQRTQFANLPEALYIRRLHRRSIISTQAGSQYRNGITIRQCLLKSILGYEVSEDLVDWLLQYNYSLKSEKRALIIKILTDINRKITPTYVESNDTKETLQNDLAYRIKLANQSWPKFLFRRIILGLSKIIPIPMRHKLKTGISKFVKLLMPEQ
ncbi:MAG: glycosyltransferase [Patescibacteria group bacterium]